MARRIPKDAMTRALQAAGSDDAPPASAPLASPPPAAAPATGDAGRASKPPRAASTGGEATADADAGTKDAGSKDAASKDNASKDAASKDAASKDAGGAADMPPIPDKLYFRIGEVAGLVGVDAHVLRYWESEFRMKPHRSSSGQRLYRKQDLARFFRVKRLLHDEGYTIAGARRVLAGGASTSARGADIPRIREALKRLQDLRGQILEIRDELDPYGRA